MPSCTQCDKPISNKSAVCPHCGRNLRVVEDRQHHQTVSCPACKARCDAVNLAGLQLDLCRRCRGLWFDRDELNQFKDAVAETDLNSDLRRLMREQGHGTSPTPFKAYLPCPVCANPMLRTNYARVSGIIVHACRDHGTWSDREASRRLLELFGDGGEERLREIAARHQDEDLARTLREIEGRQNSQDHQVAALEWRGRIHLVLDLFDIL